MCNSDVPKSWGSIWSSVFVTTSSKNLQSSDGSRWKIFDPGRVNFLWLGLGRVSHLWFGFEFGKFPLKTSNFSIFFLSSQKKSLQVGSESTHFKGGSASYLLRVKSKLRSGRVGSGQSPSLLQTSLCQILHRPRPNTRSKVLFQNFVW